MPYRRLPNTDKARLKALKIAQQKIQEDGAKNVPFSESAIEKIRVFLPKFQNALITLNAAKKDQLERGRVFAESIRKSRMYISHYIQVMNFAIAREELKPDIRKFYTLAPDDNTLPKLTTEQDLIDWGKNIIEGDRKRIMNGGSPIYNPSIALVKVNYEKFMDAFHAQKTCLATTERNINKVNELREEANQLIQQLWNETEQAYGSSSDYFKRKKSEKYGVVYVLRRTEKKQLEQAGLEPKLEF